MSEEERCNLCRENQALEVDLEKPMYKLVNKLLQRLFECYKINISILGESSCICQTCFEGVLQISESLEKWSKAQEGLQEKPLDIDDSKAFQVKLEVSSSEDEEGKSSQIEDKKETPEETQQTEPFAPNYDYFCVGIGHDGMVLTKLFKDQTKATRLVCTCCDQVFENLVQIRMHSNMARKNPLYYCGACDANFPSARLLRDHERAEEHTKSINYLRDMEFRCLQCGEAFTRFFDAIRHENSVHSSLEFICPECNMHFKYFGSFQKHLRFHRPTEPPSDVFECTYANCSRRFRVRERYSKHINWHKGLSHKCPYVGCEVTTMPGNYMRHVRSHYRQAKCLQEGKFMTLDSLQRVDPDGRKVPYSRRIDAPKAQRQNEEHAAPTTERMKINPDGEFISLPKKITLQQGRYISVLE